MTSSAESGVLKPLRVEFAGEWYSVFPGSDFLIGREGDLTIDENPYLHRTFLRLNFSEGLWWLHNVGSRLAATLTEGNGLVQSWLAPGAGVPLVFDHLVLTFAAASTTYEVNLYPPTASFSGRPPRMSVGDVSQTLGSVPLTDSQRLLILALAERRLRRPGSGSVEIPSSAQAAARLGWTLTRFNRKLDNVCDKFDRIGVDGLRGGSSTHAVNRRVRLVEYALTSLLVTPADLPLLEAEAATNRTGNPREEENAE